MTDAQGFATYLRRAMKSAGDLTSADLSRAIGVADSVVSRWLRGSVPSIENLRLLAPVLKVPVRDLVVVAGHMTPEEVGLTEIPEPPGPPPTVEDEIMAADWLTAEAKQAAVTLLDSLRVSSSQKQGGPKEQNKRERGA